MQTAIKRIIFFAAIIAFWEIGSRLELWHPLIFPSLSSVFSALVEGFQDKTLIYDLIASFKRLAVGLTISLIIGTLIGILLGKSKTADETLGAVILALQSVPSIVWLPIAIMWFGLNEKAVIFVTILGGTFVMALNMRTGIKNVSPLYIKAAQTMGATGVDLFTRVIFPASIPYVVTGSRLAWAFAWRALMAGELLSTGPGLGYTLRYASDFGRMDIVIGVMIIIGAIGMIVDQFIFQRIEKSVIKKWGLES
ncbi:ABC transporter permease [Cytobacillus firmus]|uniref:ABC transporter, permease protein (Cluster 10, nitrate/sulfonate/bicarbonate) n=1 Tax=Cytobacillus firmus TaxID=1399 RepID=A0A380XU77_CYTFI|nr:ABC transporter permease [Cytobacillus firmus]KAF0821654.1 ABC transporter, permease protein (cluster 10, nitrate/sulfonate/bicarbonate) [Cytobacillus firmus]MBG9545282.1 ABC transporter permease [Cytobacillus firmus]MBG9548010.1 ABC transporter permease [Cytobacillus firmus]MBG9554552.1 ABC transporter permease [Cytobacillus firmus]MBG9555494.1 ABC transporter permease [Cytobacillus firmus]